MKTISTREARVHLSAVVRAAQSGETTILTRNGKPVAKVIPVSEALLLHPELERELARIPSALSSEPPPGEPGSAL